MICFRDLLTVVIDSYFWTKFGKIGYSADFTATVLTTLPKGDMFSIEGPYLNDTNNRNKVVESESHLS